MNKKKFPEGFFTKDRPIAKPKYVNAEEMLNNYEADCEVYENNGDSLDAELWMVFYLKNHSSADVQPVVHAHWKNIGSGHAECSNCGMTVSADYPASPCVHYCAKCGARMDGDEHFTEPTEEENKAFDDYYKSIGTKSKENFFDGDEHD